MDFIETITPTRKRQYILAVIEHATRRIRVLATTAGWVAHTVKNLVMDLEDVGAHAAYLIRDRDAKYPAPIDKILPDATSRACSPASACQG
ncbi:hypothetical protein [Streptomyces sp. NPDC002346]